MAKNRKASSTRGGRGVTTRQGKALKKASSAANTKRTRRAGGGYKARGGK